MDGCTTTTAAADVRLPSLSFLESSPNFHRPRKRGYKSPPPSFCFLSIARRNNKHTHALSSSQQCYNWVSMCEVEVWPVLRDEPARAIIRGKPGYDKKVAALKEAMGMK